MDLIDRESELNDDLDISWTHSYEKEIHMNEQLHREPMDEINAIFIYIDSQSVITRVISKPQIIDTIVEKTDKNVGKRGISNAKVLHLVQEGKTFEMKKYKLLDILLYCVNIDPENIQKYAYSSNDEDHCLKGVNIFNDIIIPDTIFIFHKINGLYLIFKEKENNHVKYPKSILKTHSKTKKIENDKVDASISKIYTKKVLFKDLDTEVNNNMHSHNNTRKNKITSNRINLTDK